MISYLAGLSERDVLVLIAAVRTLQTSNLVCDGEKRTVDHPSSDHDGLVDSLAGPPGLPSMAECDILVERLLDSKVAPVNQPWEPKEGFEEVMGHDREGIDTVNVKQFGEQTFEDMTIPVEPPTDVRTLDEEPFPDGEPVDPISPSSSGA